MPEVQRRQERIVERDRSPAHRARSRERRREWEIPSTSTYVDTGSGDEERKRELFEREIRRADGGYHRVISPPPPPPPSWRRTPWPMPPNSNPTSIYPGNDHTYNQHPTTVQTARHHQNRPFDAGPLHPSAVIERPLGFRNREQDERELRSRIDELDHARQYGGWGNDVFRYERSQTDYHNSAANESRGLFQTVYDVANAKDVTVHLSFPVFHDDDAEIEDFSRFRRLGNFEAAKELFQRIFDGQLKNPYMFVQYAEMLLDMGDYKSFALLDPNPAFGVDLSLLQSEHRELKHHQPQYIYSQPQPVAYHHNTFAPEDSRPIGRSYYQTASVPRRSRSFERPSNRDAAKEQTTIHRASGSHHHPHSVPPRSPSPPPPHSVNQQAGPARGILPISRQAARESLILDETQLLAMNWRLLKALAIIHRDGTINDALDEARFTLKVLLATAGSTEIQIMSLALRIFGYVRLSLPDIYNREFRGVLELWTEWPELYMQLLTQGRVWDFRDIFLAAVSAFSLKKASLNFFGRESIRDKVIHSWTAHGEDESTILAQLDILVAIILDRPPPRADLNGAEIGQLKEDAQALAESIMKNYPESMKTRPFMRWLMLKATESSFKVGDVAEDERSPLRPASRPASRKQFDYLHDYTGLPFFPPPWISLPIYVPFDQELPNWHVPKLPDEANSPVRMALALATQLHDHTTQALCLKLLILTSQDPTELFDQLGQLQKSVQEDRTEYLLTCLSKFLVCRDKASQSQLLVELREMDDWTESWILRDAHACFAKQYIERVLSAKIKGRKFLPPLDTASMPYFTWLASSARRFIAATIEDDPQDTPQHQRARPPSVDGDELDIAIRERGEQRQPPSTKHGYPDHPFAPERERDLPPSSGNQDAARNEFTGRVKEPGRVVTTRVVRDRSHDAPPPPSQQKAQKSTRFVEGRTITSPELTSESSSDDDVDSEDFRQIFNHINKGVMRRELLAGKRITVSVQDSEKAEEHGSVSWARDGEWIYTTKKERILDKGAGSSEHARHLRGKRRARRRRAAESDGESTDSTKSDSDAGDYLHRREAARSEPENLEVALIRHPDPTSQGIRIIS